MEYKNLPISLLIDECALRNPMAWAEFVRRTSPLITFAIIKALVKYSSEHRAQQNDINDIKQAIFVSLWEKDKLNGIKNRDNIDYWLSMVGRNAVINFLRARRKEVLISDRSFFEKLPAEETGQRENGPEDADKKIKEFYSMLTPREKLIFKLYFKKGLALKAISGIMAIPIGTLSSAVTRMKKKIKCRES